MSKSDIYSRQNKKATSNLELRDDGQIVQERSKNMDVRSTKHAAGGHLTPRAARRLLALLAAAALATLVAACGSASSSFGKRTSSGTFATQYSTPAATQAVSSINWDMPGGEPSSLDPILVGDNSAYAILANLCDSLLTQNANFTVSSGIASSWHNLNPDTTVYTIRQGVHFWDGTTLTAKDVAYSLNRQMDPSLGGYYATYYSNVKSITATGPYQVTVTFKEPDALFNKEMATNAGSIVEEAYAQHEGKKLGTSQGGLMCSGPYRLSSWKPGQSITITSNPDYWNSALRPKVHTVTFQFITDSNALVRDLTTGSIDGSYDMPTTAVPALRGSSVGSIYYGPALATDTLFVLNPHSPLVNLKLRQALSMALDRSTFINTIYNGTAVPAKTIMPPSAWETDIDSRVFRQGYDALPALNRNLSAARALVAAVQKQGSIPPIVYATEAGNQQNANGALLIQAAAQSIGLKIEIKSVGTTQFSNMFYEPSARKGFDLLGGGRPVSSNAPDLLDLMGFVALPTGPFNFWNYSESAGIKPLEEARVTLDPARRAQLLVASQAAYSKDLTGIPIAYPNEILFMNKRISGAPASSAFLFRPWAASIGGTGGS